MYIKSGDGFFVKFEGDTPLMTTDLTAATNLSQAEAVSVGTKMALLNWSFDIIATERPEAIYEIDLSKKYVLVIEKAVTNEFAARIQANWKEFIEGDKPLMILSGMGDVKFIKVEVDNE